MAGRVFISHVREDAARVDSLCQILNVAGIPVWRDTTSLWPGEDWRTKIRCTIRSQALVFLACFSQQGISRVRSYQNERVNLAIDELRKHPPGQPWLIPIRFDKCQIPEREVGGGRRSGDARTG